MTTRRERAEARAARRREWAAGREEKADALHHQNEPYRGDVAFNTQPGRIPERTRANRRAEAAWEHTKMAAHHAARADGIDRQLERTIFSDDPDAPERLRERIAGLEAQRDRAKAYNLERRKAGAETLPGYVLTNLGANIRRLRARLEAIERERAADAAGGAS